MALSAAETLEREATVPAVLKTSCVLLTKDLEAHACNLSRVVGQLLVDLCEHSFDGRRIQLGRGYLLPDFPLTQEVIERREPRIVSLFDADVDESEAELLRDLRFDSLLMIPLIVDEDDWGLFEVYREGEHLFTAEHVARATAIVQTHEHGARSASPPRIGRVDTIRVDAPGRIRTSDQRLRRPPLFH